MRYVLDCSVALKWFVPEDLSEIAWEVLRQTRAGSLSLTAPDILIPEFGHTLRRLVIGKQMSRQEARVIWEKFRALDVELVPVSAVADATLALAIDHMATFFDALYVSLAIRDDLRVLTADNRMASAFAKLDRVVRLADFPSR